MKKFWGKDFGIIALAKNYPAQEIQIKISRDFTEKTIQESDFWLDGVKKIVKKTKFGRIGIAYDRKNKEAKSFCKTLAKEGFDYQQKNPRAEKSAKFSFIEMQVVCEMANEGLADSVEFRRLIRKYLRNAKHLHLDSIFFLESIFAENKTRQILAKIAGTQIKTYFVTDFLNLNTINNDLKNPAKKKFFIKTNDDLSFTKKRAEKILQKKLKNCDIERVK